MSAVDNRLKSRAVGTITNFVPVTWLALIIEIKAEMGSNFGGNRWNVASDSDLELTAALVRAKPFSALATRGGIALRITS